MLPLLWLTLMLQKITTNEEAVFWHGLDLEMREELELGVAPLGIQLKDVGQQIWWGPEPEMLAEGPHLSPLGAEPMEVEGGAKEAQEDGATAEDDAMAE